MYKSCNHWTVIMSHYRNYLMKIILLLRITTMKPRRDSTHPSHPTEISAQVQGSGQAQRRKQPVERWNPTNKNTSSFCCGLLFDKSSTALFYYILYIFYIFYGQKSTDLAVCNVFQVPNSITTTPQNSYVPVATNLLGATARWSPVFCHSLPQPLLFKRHLKTCRVSPGSMNQSIMISVPRPGGCWLCYGSKVAPRVVVSSRTHRNCGAHPDRVLCFSTTMIHYIYIYIYVSFIYTVSFCRSDRRISLICSDSKKWRHGCIWCFNHQRESMLRPVASPAPPSREAHRRAANFCSHACSTRNVMKLQLR